MKELLLLSRVATLAKTKGNKSSYNKMLSIYAWHFKDVTSAVKPILSKLIVCGRTCAEATVYIVPFIRHCVLSMHTGQRITLL